MRALWATGVRFAVLDGARTLNPRAPNRGLRVTQSLCEAAGSHSGEALDSMRMALIRIARAIASTTLMAGRGGHVGLARFTLAQTAIAIAYQY